MLATISAGDRWLFVAALAFGLLVVISVLVFVRIDRKGSSASIDRLTKRGINVSTASVADTSASAARLDLPVPAENAAPTVTGPRQVVVDVPTEFSVNVDGVTLTVQPPTAATVEAKPGAPRTVVVTATTIGAFKLLANAAGRTQGELVVGSVNPSVGAPVSIPFIGSGWGSIVVATVIASVTAALGAIQVLGGQAIATILGALVGYVVAKGSAAQSGSTSPSKSDTTHS